MENALYVRLTEHQSDISHQQVERPVSRHFILPGHSLQDLSIMVIEKIHRDDTDFRSGKETHRTGMI